MPRSRRAELRSRWLLIRENMAMRKNVIQWCALALTGAAFVAGCADPATKTTGKKSTGTQSGSTTGGGVEVPLPAGGGNAAEPMPEPTPAEPTPAKPEEKPAEPAPAKPEEKPADAPKAEEKPADAPKAEEVKPADSEKKPE